MEEILLCKITPYFLERDVLWFEKNKQKIKQAIRSQSWWKRNALLLELNQRINLYAALRKITELGYEKVGALSGPGEFSHRGGIIDIFPASTEQAFRLEFIGNQINQISPLKISLTKKEKEKSKKELQSRATLSLLSKLKKGDYVVHLDHGIGRFLGITLTKPRTIRRLADMRGKHDKIKYYTIEYAKGDKLYVPQKASHKLGPYFGFQTPIIHRLGGTLWYKTKRRVRESALKLAKELLEIYAKRELVEGFQYLPDDELQKELESAFPYVETEDQLITLEAIKKDMESARPMDRLICGDVGFGKTELALRTAFKAVLSSKQVALIAPTTILAEQHYNTFSKRLKKLPVKIGFLSRLQSEKAQKSLLEKIKTGQVDIVIGTHRLLSSDVQFKNLGLAIIDEEQKFGVRQKEKFKEIRANPPKAGFGTDILSLTATPIPRTMYLALSGLKNISVINTPPPGRLAVKTFILPFSKVIIKGAIQKEIKRGGQVYYLHNRVETINIAAHQIKKLVPHAKVATVHGRLPEKQLVKIMRDFRQKKIDVLVATTIIENGLDFANVNTLIVANAVRLGLAQTYQIRGRIGRSWRQAYAYFLYPAPSEDKKFCRPHTVPGRYGVYHSKRLTDKARQRLQALKEAENLGSGYQIALKDLEIRGAGNILGKEQSGNINRVGLNLYCQMLNEAVEKLKKHNANL